MQLTAIPVQRLESCDCECTGCDRGAHCRTQSRGCLMPLKSQAPLKLLKGLAKQPRRRRVKVKVAS